MKPGWQAKPLGAVCDIVNGGTPKTSVPEYWDGDNLWITPAEMGGRKTPYVSDTERKITEFGLRDSSARMLPANSVILSSRAPIGHLVINTKPMATNQGCKGLLPGRQLHYKYLYYFLSSIVDKLNDLGTGATFKELSGSKLREVTIPLPDASEQRRIVDILDASFDRVVTIWGNTGKNLQNAVDLFDQCLQTAFVCRNDAWMAKTLSDISVDFGRGKSKHRPRNDPALYGGKYPFIQTGDVRNSDHLITSFSRTYNEFGLAQSKLWPKGTICVTIAANIAETGILDFPACFPDSVVGVVVDENQTSTKYLEYLLQSFKARLQAQGKGSAQANINLETFENQKFPFPNLKMQAEIVATLDALRESIRRLEIVYKRKLAALDELKKSLLHQAFTGNL